MEGQAQWVTLEFLPAGSAEAVRRYPSLAPAGRPEELIVVGDDGSVYREDAAYLMCLYALRDYREWSLRLADPARRPLARQAFTWLARHRATLSRFLGASEPACDDGGTCPTRP
jgi:predicted DCC family thiol-disulfide oxidoreductase YuxK